MLESLSIRNYAIIDGMTVEFTGGLNVITGETGAGKSIVVDALELVLGARASSEMIRAGETFLDVTGVFTVDSSPVRELLPFDLEDSVLILRREVRADGNNRCFINDHPVTLKLLKEIGDRLVDFHGQHDHQSLLNVADHVGFLDGFGGLDGLAEEVKRFFSEMTDKRRELASLRQAVESARRDRDLYSFQCDEIDKIRPRKGEDEDLEASIRRLSSATELKTLSQRIFLELSEEDGSASQRLGDFAAEIENIVDIDAELVPVLERMNDLVQGVEDIARFFREYADSVEDDPALLAECDERLAALEKLRKKYGPSLDDVIAYREKIGKELEKAEMSDEHLIALENECKAIQSTLAERARELSEKRRIIAPKLSSEVESHLAELGMNGSRLVVDIGPSDSGESIECEGKSVNVTENGIDRVEFLISANPGEPPRPLVKVASGGEISRTMLALKLALSDVTLVPSMVFDEIDVGVSGRVAESIGKKLMKLTEQRQALVITHLPQIAAMADRHFSARKRIEGDRTLAGLILLDRDMREKELAMLLSGETLTETALAHARRLMDDNTKRK